MTDQAEQLRTAARTKGLEQAAYSNRQLAGQSRVLAVTSGKGGVGKTSLVVNLGLALSRLGYRVVIIDADLGLANIDVMINSVSRYNLTDVINGSKNIRDVIMKGPLDLKIIPGGTGLFDLANLDQARRGVLLDQLSELEDEGDFIIIDTAAGISRQVISFVEAADDFILVTTPEPTAMTDAYSVLKVLSDRGLKDKGKIVVNLTRNLQQGHKIFAGLSRVVQKYLPSMELNYLGDVRHDPAVSNAVHSFVPFVISNPQSAASTAVSRIAWRIASNSEAEQPSRRGIAGFINQLKGLS